MNRHLNLISALSVLSLTLAGCAGPSYRLSAQEPEGVKVVTGSDAAASVVLSERPGSMIVLSPKEESGLTGRSELWFNLVAINKADSPVDFSIGNVRALVNGTPAAVPNAEELEELITSAANRASLLAWGSLLLTAASVGASGGDALAFTQQMMPSYIQAESMGEETNAELLKQYQNTVLKPQTIAPAQNHGGLIRIIPETPIAAFSSIDLSFDVGADTHLLRFVVQAEVE